MRQHRSGQKIGMRFCTPFLSKNRITYSAFILVLIAMPGNTIPVMGLGVMIAILTDTAFMTPSANPSCPLIFGSGYITMGEGVKYGGIMVALSFIVAITLIWPLACLVF